MNILFISNDPSIFDEKSSTRERMRSYAKEIGTLHIISRVRSAQKEDIQEDLSGGTSLILHPIGSTMPLAFFSMYTLARSLIRTKHIELVSTQDPFEYGLIGMYAVKGTVAKLYVQLHTDAFSPWFTRAKIFRSSEIRMPLLNKIRQHIAAQVLPQADGIRVVSERITDSLHTRFGDTIVTPTVIPIAIPTVVPPSVPLPAHAYTFSLISVGRLEAEKRIQDTLAALARIHLRYPQVGLFLVGEGRERKNLEAYAKKLGIAANVQFLGKRNDAWGLMQSAQAFIQSSGYEGYGLTLIEAALARVPIITTDVGIVGEVFKGYQDVLATPPGDPANLAALIVGLVEDNTVRRELAMNAEKTAQAHIQHIHNTPADIVADMKKLLV